MVCSRSGLFHVSPVGIGQAAVLLQQIFVLQGLPDSRVQVGRVAGLGEELVDVARVDGANGRFGRGTAGQHDADDIRIVLGRPNQQVAAAHAWHLLVADQDVDRVALEHQHRFHGRGGRIELVAAAARRRESA